MFPVKMMMYITKGIYYPKKIYAGIIHWGGRGHWVVYYRSPQNFIIMFLELWGLFKILIGGFIKLRV